MADLNLSRRKFSSRVRWSVITTLLALAILLPTPSLAAITIEPSTWNVIGLDSNTPAIGPYRFPVGAKVCGGVPGTSTTATFHWDRTNPYVTLRGTQEGVPLSIIYGLNGCADAFFEVEVNRTSAAFTSSTNLPARYYITSNGVSTPRPRELIVERLVSQSRNAITDMRFATTLAGLDNPASSVPNGGSMDLMVDNTYYIRMSGFTATQGYEQLETFVNFPNTIFQVLSVRSTYSADTSPLVNSPNDKLYADSCGWDNDPTSPTYLSCTVSGKAGGQITVTYEVKILSVASSRETLSSLIHDFSGSSFHYNADYSTSARFANIVNPASITVDKSFSPEKIAINGTSVLTITLSNPNYSTVTDVSLSDTFPTPSSNPAAPGNMTLKNDSHENGCGGTLSDLGGGGLGTGDTGIRLVGGSIPARGSCTIKVNVTADIENALIPYRNRITDLKAGSTLSTSTAQADLYVDSDFFPDPVPPSDCANPTVLATWTFEGLTLGGITNPPNSNTPPTGVSNILASCEGCSASTIISTPVQEGSRAWSGGYWLQSGSEPQENTQPYFQFGLSAPNYGGLRIQLYSRRAPTGWAGSNSIAVFGLVDGTGTPLPGYSTGSLGLSYPGTPYSFKVDKSGANTQFRVKGYYANNSSSLMYVDNVTIDGCPVVPTKPPTIIKEFLQDPVAVGATSTLRFTISNPNTTDPGPALSLSAIKVTDVLPAGLSVIDSTSNACGGTNNLVVTAADRTLKLTGGSLAAPAGTSPTTCTFDVTVTANLAGTFDNTSQPVSAEESGGNTDSSTGIARDALTVLAAPMLTKAFNPTTIFTAGGDGDVSTLTITLTNPNPAGSQTLTSVGFTDNLPTVAGSPPGTLYIFDAASASNSCGGTLDGGAAPPLANGNTTLRLTGVTLAAGASCTVTVKVKGSAAGLYTNSSAAYHTLNGYTGTGAAGTAQLLVEDASPGIALLKQVGPTDDGPWSSYLAVATGGSVYYHFVIENTGDVDLSSVDISDPTLLAAGLNPASCAWKDGDGAPLTAPFTLPVADADEGHLALCTIGPLTAAAGTHDNTATASGTFGTGTYTDTSTATYATTAVTLTKTADKPYYMAVDEVMTYTYAIYNSGANLADPITITVTDNKISSVICPTPAEIGDFNNGETVICTATYTVTASDLIAEQITNIARANIRDDGTLNINTPQATATVLAGPDLVVTKTNSVGGNASTNVPFTWTLTVSNTTSLGMTATFTDDQRLLVDHLPSGPTYGVPAVATNTGGTTGTISCTLDVTGLILTCAATGDVTIPPDGGFTIAVTATPATPGTLTNPTGGVCRIDPDGAIDEINNANNDCADTVTVTTPAVTLTKTANKSYFTAAGETIAYSYKVKNTGANILGSTGPPVTPVSFTVADDKVSVTCPDIRDIGNLDINFDTNEELTCTSTAPYTVLAADVTSGLVTNTATATVTPAMGPLITSPPVSLTVPIGPDLSVVKTHPAATPIPLTPFNWTLTVTNAPTAGYPANFTDTQVLLRDDLPAGLTYGLAVPTPATLNGTATGTINCTIAADTLTCVASGAVSIPPGSGFSIDVTTTALAGGTLTNPRGGGICRVDPTGTVPGPGNGLVLETNESNNDCSDSVLVGMPSLTFLKMVQPYSDPVNGTTSPKAIPGALMQYTFTVTNFGYGPTDAGTLEIVDTIPDNMEMYVADINGGGSGPVRFIDGTNTATTAPSGLSYSFISLDSTIDKLSFSSDGSTFNYNPTADSEGYDPAVKKFKVSFNNNTVPPYDIFAGTDGIHHPTFSLLFRAKIK